MVDIVTLFDKQDDVSKFAEIDRTLTPDERMKLHTFFEGTYKTTTIAKSFMGLSAGLTMAWIAKRKRKVSPLYAMLGGVGISAFVFSYMTPTIYQTKLRELENQYGKDSKIYKMIEVTPHPADYAYYWKNYFQDSIIDKNIRVGGVGVTWEAIRESKN